MKSWHRNVRGNRGGLHSPDHISGQLPENHVLHNIFQWHNNWYRDSNRYGRYCLPGLPGTDNGGLRLDNPVLDSTPKHSGDWRQCWWYQSSGISLLLLLLRHSKRLLYWLPLIWRRQDSRRDIFPEYCSSNPRQAEVHSYLRNSVLANAGR